MKKLGALMVSLIVLAIGFAILTNEQPEKGGKYNQKVEKKSITLEVTTNGRSAKMRYFTTQIEVQDGYVETPWTKTVLTETAKITAYPGFGASRVACRITDASSGKVLDSDSGRQAVCSFSTF